MQPAAPAWEASRLMRIALGGRANTMPPSDINLRQGPVAISTKDPKRLDEIHGWIHDRKYDPDDVRYRASERILEVPFLCTVYQNPTLQRGFVIVQWWWIPVVRGYLRFHHVRDFSIRADGPGIINAICVAASGHEFRLTGVSEVCGVVDE